MRSFCSLCNGERSDNVSCVFAGWFNHILSEPELVGLLPVPSGHRGDCVLTEGLEVVSKCGGSGDFDLEFVVGLPFCEHCSARRSEGLGCVPRATSLHLHRLSGAGK